MTNQRYRARTFSAPACGGAREAQRSTSQHPSVRISTRGASAACRLGRLALPDADFQRPPDICHWALGGEAPGGFTLAASPTSPTSHWPASTAGPEMRFLANGGRMPVTTSRRTTALGLRIRTQGLARRCSSYCAATRRGIRCEAGSNPGCRFLAFSRQFGRQPIMRLLPCHHHWAAQKFLPAIRVKESARNGRVELNGKDREVFFIIAALQPCRGEIEFMRYRVIRGQVTGSMELSRKNVH